jgi:hypothetical protein
MHVGHQIDFIVRIDRFDQLGSYQFACDSAPFCFHAWRSRFNELAVICHHIVAVQSLTMRNAILDPMPHVRTADIMRTLRCANRGTPIQSTLMPEL